MNESPLFGRIEFVGNVAIISVAILISVVLPQGIDAPREYLKDLNVPVYDVRQISLDSLGVSGTPTLILVDSEGRVKGSWIGKLPPKMEAEVLSSLQCNSCGY